MKVNNDMIRICSLILTFLLLVQASVGTSYGGYAGNSTAEEDFFIPVEAIRLLAKSRNNSCSICVEKLQAEAFEILTSSLIPYKKVPVEENCPAAFASVNYKPELRLTCYPEVLDISENISEIPHLVFRFHTRSDHMIGISPEDYTEDEIGGPIFSAPAKRQFYGLIQFIPFRYGDGPTFLYFTDSNRLVIQCRIVEIKTVD